MTERPADPWSAFRRFTQARIALGRSGDGLPTPHVLDFQLAHAQARDAVLGRMDVAVLRAQLKDTDLADHPIVTVTSRAENRSAFLQRPDLGRQLSESDGDTLRAAHTSKPPDVVFVIGDGLSALAIESYAIEVFSDAMKQMPDLSVGPLVMAQQARVALGDEIAVALNAQAVIILIGERPGLSAADSLGAYLTYRPRIGSQNADRNCISNIRNGGLYPREAAARINYLLRAAIKQGQSGFRLKDLSENELLTSEDP